jgi:hypothetical protein
MSKLWGVPGKQRKFLSGEDFARTLPIERLNENPFQPWDLTKSRYKRVDGRASEEVQQGGVVPEVSSGPAVTPSPTPSQTVTPSITPSSTPYPLPINPSLWWDASDSSTFTLISSGGSNYVSSWVSKGSSTWSLTGASTDTMPVVSASTLMPGNPNIVRFNPNATTALRDGLLSFNNTPINHSGGTWFYVWAKPSGATYANALYTAAVYSGLSNGGVVQIAGGAFQDRQFLTIQNTANLQNTYSIGNFTQANSAPLYSATGLNDKYIMSFNFQASNGEFSNLELNQSAQTFSTVFTGATIQPQVNSFIMGLTITSSAGTQSYNNSNVELCEAMWFNSNLTPAQREQVELYLKDKWRYDEWASPVPTPTPTASTTATPTPSVTPTMTNTPTITNTPTTTVTPSPTSSFTPATLNPMIWIDFNDVSTLSLRSGQYVQSVSNKGNWTSMTGFSQTTAADQPSWSASTMGTGKSAVTISNDWLVASTYITGDTWNTFAVMKFSSSTPSFSVVSAAGASFGGGSGFWAPIVPQPASPNFRYINALDQNGATTQHRVSFTGYSGYNTTQVCQSYISNSATTIVDYMNFNNSGTTETVLKSNLTQTGMPGVYSGGTYFSIINSQGSTDVIVGEIGEIIMYNKELTSTEQSNLVNYLKNKWGIT